jgi:hypothetical protein
VRPFRTAQQWAATPRDHLLLPPPQPRPCAPAAPELAPAVVNRGGQRRDARGGGEGSRGREASAAAERCRARLHFEARAALSEARQRAATKPRPMPRALLPPLVGLPAPPHPVDRAHPRYCMISTITNYAQKTVKKTKRHVFSEPRLKVSTVRFCGGPGRRKEGERGERNSKP